MALHCTSFLAMYVPSKYGGGVVCVCVSWMEGCVCASDGGGEGEVREEKERRSEGGGGHVLLLTSRKFSTMTLEK